MQKPRKLQTPHIIDTELPDILAALSNRAHAPSLEEVLRSQEQDL